MSDTDAEDVELGLSAEQKTLSKSMTHIEQSVQESAKSAQSLRSSTKEFALKIQIMGIAGEKVVIEATFNGVKLKHKIMREGDYWTFTLED